VKSAVRLETVTEFLGGPFDEPPLSVGRLKEGMKSHAFRFEIGRSRLVVRIASAIRGFEKDSWAYVTVGKQVPVPRVVALGRFDAENAYCITEWSPGVTLEDLVPSVAETLVDEVRDVWSEIAKC